jgi:flagellar export protein FliJ
MMLQAKKTVECEKRVERAKAGLLEAMRDRKKFDNLKARKFKAYEKLAGRLEQKELDAFGSQMMLRRSKTRAATQAASRM